MANVKISALPAAVAASGTDVVPVVQGTTTKKLSMSRLLTSPTLFAPGMSTFFATPSSANLRGVLTDETGTGSAVFADAPALTTPTISGGDMEFSSLGQRIKGDLTTTTVSNRLLFQTSTVNGTTSVGAIPDGTATTAGFAAANSSDANNASIAILQATPTVVSVTATKTGTGSFLPLTFVTSSIERLRIDTSGNVNIPTAGARITGDFTNATWANRLAFQTSTVNGGTNVPVLPNGTGTASQIALFGNSDPTNASYAQLVQIGATETRISAAIQGTGTYTPLTFYTGGSERVRVDTSGNVGIGTASPGERFNVNSTGAEYAIQWNSTGSNNWVLASATNRAYIANKSTPAEVLTILNGGNVGIGTASPGFRLDVSGTARFTGITRFDNAIDLKTATLNYVYFDDALAFARNGVGERMRIDSSGNVGIGTASPGTKLDVFNTGTTTTDFRVRNSTVSLSSFVDSGASYVGASTNHPLLLITNNNERMRIDSSGNIVAGASAALATNATNGFLYVPTCAGTPTGVPTAITGMAPIVVNTTNNKLYFYSGGAWRDAGP
jgi:hypothetical protein